METSWVRDQKDKGSLELKINKVVLSSRPKKEKKLPWIQDQRKQKMLSWDQDQQKEVLISRLKISINFISKKVFYFNIAGNEIQQVGEYLNYMPEMWLESCFRDFPGSLFLSRTREVSTLELLAPANIQSRALQTEVELQNQWS